jgi:hypothetical protein
MEVSGEHSKMLNLGYWPMVEIPHDLERHYNAAGRAGQGRAGTHTLTVSPPNVPVSTVRASPTV